MGKEDNTKSMKYVWNILKTTISTIKDVDFPSYCIVLIYTILSQFSYNFETFLSTTGATVSWFLQPWDEEVEQPSPKCIRRECTRILTFDK